MALNKQQRAMAALIYGMGRRKGLNDARARELVAAAYAESGLNPTIRNKTSGATGLFQLLSPGYVNKANQMGGAANPRANINAILPDYLNYWRMHPNAAPGEAGRDVERSGEGAGFYSSPLSVIGNQFGAAPPPTMGPSPLNPMQTTQPAHQNLPAENPHAYSDFAMGLIQSLQNHNPAAMLGAIMNLRSALAKPEPVTPPVQPPSREAPKMGPGAPAMGGNAPLAEMIRAEKIAKMMGLRVSENYNAGGVNPVHVPHSYHYRKYPNSNVGRAIDVTGSPQQMSAFTRRMLQLGGTSELFFDPLGGWKYGKSIGPIGHHGTHVHVAY